MIWARRLMAGKSEAAAPRGRRAYAIGDVHGRLDLLVEMLAAIEADNGRRAKARTTIVFLGDLIDRGPQSAQVIERLRLYRPPFANTVFLMGNHEEVLLRILGGEMRLLPDWLQFGGAETLRSYAVDAGELRGMRSTDALELIRRKIPAEHMKFLSSFVDSASFGRYLFVHAGIRPGIPLASQAREDLRWIREPFLNDESDHGHIVVHGHSISEEVELRPNRIGLDTGAYRTGVLSAIGIEGAEHWLIQTGGDTSKTDGTASVANYSVAY
jgi:serine/threonine protein phosphatase 1